MRNRRSDAQLEKLILSVAESDVRIRAVLLNGSRANPNIAGDRYQDFDIVYLVQDFESFRGDLGWLDVFGERIILQKPNAMQIDEVPPDPESIVYLMLFRDHHRIDLRISKVETQTGITDSLTKVLLDKDDRFPDAGEPTDADYLISRPTQRQFSDCCNEFWWVTTYVAKGIARREPLYAKAMLEGPVRKMFQWMLGWYVGTRHGYNVNLGRSNRFLQRYVSAALWREVLATYPDADLGRIKESLRVMTSLFDRLSRQVAADANLQRNTEEAANVRRYLRDVLGDIAP